MAAKLRFLQIRRAVSISGSPMNAFRRLFSVVVLASSIHGWADEIGDPNAAGKGIADAQAAVKSFSVGSGLKVEVWASEPLLTNPVALAFDDQGRAYVAETYRRRTSVLDIRRFEDWTVENLALRSVEDRTAFLQRKLPEAAVTKPGKDKADRNGDGQYDWRDLAVESERIKIVEDADGDGHADRSSVLAEGFNSVATGVGAGVCPTGGKEDPTFYTCAPDLWKISADGSKEKLFSGFAVHVAYGGHDLHGPKVGPDGRLYWSIADCGAHVVGKEGQVIDVPDSGAVFRCETDGSKLELVAKGLRNPQSLAFNELGDLFTGDNNADGGDKARWIHVVEGADYGWRIGWQFLPKLGAWNAEGMWHLDAERNLNILPPAGHVGHGPAGIAYYPGTGLPDSYHDHFFMADFPGGARAFTVRQKGASYVVSGDADLLQDNSPQKLNGKMLWGLYPSDVAFAPGGGLYVLDWIQGWEKTGKGRIFRVFDPAADESPLTRETRQILKEGFSQRDIKNLASLLGHADQRVRLGAQFELVRRGDPVPLAQATLSGNPRLMRLHGIWGVTQLARRKPATAQSLLPLSTDTDAEVRAQWAKFVGDARVTNELDLVQRLIADPEPRVRFQAAMAIARCQPTASPALFKALATDDPYLRHAAVVALSRCGQDLDLSAGINSFEPAARSGGLQLLLGRYQNDVPSGPLPFEQPFLSDVARAVHDAPIKSQWPQLAALASQADLSEPIWRRVINTNYLLGDATSAQRLATSAAETSAPVARRVFAIESLALWNQPFGRDRITGLWRDLPPRDQATGAREAAAGVIKALLLDSRDDIRLAALAMAGSLHLDVVTETMVNLVGNSAEKSGKVRAAALQALASMESPRLTDALNTALQDNDRSLLEAARRVAAKVSPAMTVKVNAAVLGKGSIVEQQDALAVISQQPGAEADRIIIVQLDLLAAGKIPPSLRLDLLEAATRRADSTIQARIAAYEQARAADDPLARWRECLEGGNAKLGREIFFEKAEAACLRCHKVKGEGGDVGPDLAGIATHHDREYILRSIVDPNAVIATGFDNVLLTLHDGNIVAGLLSTEDDQILTLKSLADGSPQKVAKAKIKERMAVPSAMPPGLGDVLGRRSLRDIVEYLVTLK